MSKGLIYSVKAGLSVGFIALAVVSLIAPNAINAKSVLLFLIVAFVDSCVGYIISYLELFSKNVWVRRTISFFITVFIALALAWAFGYYSLTDKMLWKLVLIILLDALLVFFVYYVQDKIMQKHLVSINKKLDEMDV